MGNAVRVMEIATGQRQEGYEAPESEGKDPAAAALGRKGGKAHAERMTPERRARSHGRRLKADEKKQASTGL